MLLCLYEYDRHCCLNIIVYVFISSGVAEVGPDRA